MGKLIVRIGLESISAAQNGEGITPSNGLDRSAPTLVTHRFLSDSQLLDWRLISIRFPIMKTVVKSGYNRQSAARTQRRKPRSTISYASRSTITEPGKRGGKPCIRGMRITVYNVLSYLAAGMSHQDIFEDFPYLTEDDILASLGYVATCELQTLVAQARSCGLTRTYRQRSTSG